MKKWSVAVVAGVLALWVGNAYATPVPEIDAGSSVTALSILTGVVALAVERLRRR